MASTSGNVFSILIRTALNLAINYKVCVDARGKERMLKKQHNRRSNLNKGLAYSINVIHEKCFHNKISFAG